MVYDIDSRAPRMTLDRRAVIAVSRIGERLVKTVDDSKGYRTTVYDGPDGDIDGMAVKVTIDGALDQHNHWLG